MTKKRLTKPCIKADVVPELKEEFTEYWKSKGYRSEAHAVTAITRDQVIKHRTPVELVRLTKVYCEIHMQQKINGFVEYEGKEVKDVFGCINEVKTPLL